MGGFQPNAGNVSCVNLGEGLCQPGLAQVFESSVWVAPSGNAKAGSSAGSKERNANLRSSSLIPLAFISVDKRSLPRRPKAGAQRAKAAKPRPRRKLLFSRSMGARRNAIKVSRTSSVWVAPPGNAKTGSSAGAKSRTLIYAHLR